VIVSGTGYVTGPRADAGQRLEAHLKYIQYRAGGEGEGPRTVFGETDETLSLREAHEMILDQGRDGLRFHKIVISPAESERVGDWTAFTRQVMDDLGRRVGLQLTWCATVHQNTDHPHVHIVVAGDGERADGQVVQARLYTPHYDYLRERAEWHTEQAWDQLFAPRAGSGSVQTTYASSGDASGREIHAPETMHERFSGAEHTAVSRVILDRIGDGTLTVVFDPTLDAYGGASGGGRITVNPRGSLDQAVSTFVHEGRHDLDIAAGIIPPPDDATPFERALAEARAFWAEAQFARLNNLVESQAFVLKDMGPIELLITLAEDPSYGGDKEIGQLSDVDLRRIAESLE